MEEVSRDRVLSDSEIRDIWFACDRLDNAYGPMVQMAILTGQRRNELAGMVPAELDIKKIVWSIPPERNKANVPTIFRCRGWRCALSNLVWQAAQNLYSRMSQER